jgi:hypothetical protein
MNPRIWLAWSLAVIASSQVLGDDHSAGSRLRAIVASGQPAPGGGSFDRFGAPMQPVVTSPNRRGEVAFFATLQRSRAAEGLFVSHGERITKIALAGDRVPGAGTLASFAKHPAPALNSAGAVAFCATLAGERGPEGVFLFSHGKLEVIALAGASAPGVNGGTLIEFESPALNDRAEAAFLATVRQGQETFDTIYLYRNGRLQKLVVAGQPAPGGGEFSSFGIPSLNNEGVIAFPAVVQDGPAIGGIFTIQRGSTRMLVAAGGPAPGGGIFAQFSERLAINDRGSVAFSAVLKLGPVASALYLAENGRIRSVVKVGDAAPGEGNFASFSLWPGLSESGEVGFAAAIRDGPAAAGVYLAGPKGIVRVAGVGDRLPDGRPLTSLTLYPLAAVSPNGAVTFATAAYGAGFGGIVYYGPAAATKP